MLFEPPPTSLPSDTRTPGSPVRAAHIAAVRRSRHLFLCPPLSRVTRSPPRIYLARFVNYHADRVKPFQADSEGVRGPYPSRPRHAGATKSRPKRRTHERHHPYLCATTPACLSRRPEFHRDRL